MPLRIPAELWCQTEACGSCQGAPTEYPICPRSAWASGRKRATPRVEDSILEGNFAHASGPIGVLAHCRPTSHAGRVWMNKKDAEQSIQVRYACKCALPLFHNINIFRFDQSQLYSILTINSK